MNLAKNEVLMEIYVMRHGRTIWNEKHICQGRSQNRLSDFGKSQVKEQARKYKDVKIDYIFSSPLMRAMQTANIMNTYHKAKIVRDNRITEVNQGIFTGQKKENLTDEQKFAMNQLKKGSGVETHEEIYKRTIDFINYLRQNYKDKNILVVTHGIVASYIEKIGERLCLEQDELKSYSTFGNAEIKKVTI